MNFQFKQHHRSGDDTTLPPYIYFGHSESTNTVLAALGLYNDSDPLTASMWPREDHLWQTSKMLSFSHNLALVVMQCKDTAEPLNLLTYHQEKRVVIPACGEELCPLNKFLDHTKSIEEVDFYDICNNSSQSANLFNIHLLFLMCIFSLVGFSK